MARKTFYSPSVFELTHRLSLPEIIIQLLLILLKMRCNQVNSTVYSICCWNYNIFYATVLV